VLAVHAWKSEWGSSPGHVDRGHLWEAEVPQQTWVDKRRDKAARRGIHVDVDFDVALDEEVVDTFDVLVLAGECGTENSA
jgi:hypothetical protein